MKSNKMFPHKKVSVKRIIIREHRNNLTLSCTIIIVLWKERTNIRVISIFGQRARKWFRKKGILAIQA